MQLEFTSVYKGLPARIFDTTREATKFTRELLVKMVPFRIHLIPPNKRKRTSLRTAVVLLDTTRSDIKVH